MFFIASKLFWILFRPLTLLMLGLGMGLGLRFTRWRRAGGWLVTLSLVAMIVGEYTTLGAMALLPLENRFPPPTTAPNRVDGIIVLGGAVWSGTVPQARNQVLLTSSAERMTEAVALARRYPEARIAFTGFSGALSPDGWTEAQGAARLFRDLGVDQDRILYEGRARNTAENAVFLRDMVSPAPGQTWLLITSASHMPRAMGTFRHAGWSDLVPWPVDYILPPRVSFGLKKGGGLGVLGQAMHEWIGLLAYWMTDRIPTPFPAPKPPPAG